MTGQVFRGTLAATGGATSSNFTVGFTANPGEVTAIPVSGLDIVLNYPLGSTPIDNQVAGFNEVFNGAVTNSTPFTVADFAATGGNFVVEIDGEGSVPNNTPGSASNLGVLGSTALGPTSPQMVGQTDTQDYFRFSVSQTKTVRIQLQGLGENANVELLNDAGTVVQGSGLNTGTTNESFEAVLNPGQYLVRVFNASGGLNNNGTSTEYQLTVSDVNSGGGGGGTGTVTLTSPTVDSTSTGGPSPNLPNNGFLPDGRYTLTDNADTVNLATINGITDTTQVLARSGADNVTGRVSADIIIGNNGTDTLTGLTGGDQLLGGKASDQVLGGSGNDTLRGDINNDTVDGGDDNDKLFGGRGRDVLLGGNGNDILLGDLEQDFLTGNAGSDIFVLRGGVSGSADRAQSDLVLDFVQGTDKVGITSELSFSSLTFETVNVVLDGGSAVASTAIREGASGNYLGILEGFSGTLTANDFATVAILPLAGFGDVTVI